MTQENQSTLHPELVLGDVLPSYNDNNNSNHLYVSLSELVMDRIFYHPSIESHLDTLTDIEKTSLDAILGDKTVDEHFVSTLVIAIQAAVQPNHTSVRIALSSADSYGFRSLLGGNCEAEEINPALGVRGVARYATSEYSKAFALECQVIKTLREQGINVEVVVPYVRALSDAAKIIDLLAEQGLPRGLNGLKVLFSCDVPSAVLLSERLLHYFDGVVVNVDSLASFTLGVDKHNEAQQHAFDPQNEAVITLLSMIVKATLNAKKPVLLVTQGLVDYPRLQGFIADLDGVETVVTA
ncbi:putative PEP-binding protein [Vibrio splendidus]|jgi:pyruvate,water dikinase|uniref:PEP-binding protein n=1 Tax=Vibrio splendidus TaxID=29497 RepID=A0ABV4LU20_VIBSP|nr:MULTISPECIES: putative PEP-binding protein [Vibrio]MBE8566057.1 phosphoenolpyruvate synthase [Vibrio sp. OPT20]MCQ8869706.1 phosphoenolpyruvate synthase [Vibrio splendidus]MDH5918731.1 phosphoenolpyruvate synthase [Vibrio splendidus]OEF33867.1 phosphoenolpyruvate synthase [Vibrio splendidus 1S-124]PHX05533.1 Phosphoenolpyruvate synthase [Vibrio splendidus]